MTYTYDLEIGEEIITVDFEAHPRWENDGIGSYEYWGQKCFDKGNDYVSLEHYGDPTYDKSKHTPEEVELIEAWLKVEKNYEELDEYICDQFTKESLTY